MRRSIGAASAAAVAAASLLPAAAGCGGSGSSRAEPAQPKPTPTAPAPAAKVQPAPKAKPTGRAVGLHRSDYGRILADGRGRALYLFTHDTAKSRCYGACAGAWPPFLTKGQPRATGEVRQGLLGTVRRSDGKRQVTYAGHPLYYYVGDKEPGQVLCQAVLEYGGYWHVVRGDGSAVR